MILPDPSHMPSHSKTGKIDKGAESLSFAKAMKDTKSLDTYASDEVKATEVKEVSMKAFLSTNMCFVVKMKDKRFFRLLSTLCTKLFQIHRYNSEYFL